MQLSNIFNFNEIYFENYYFFAKNKYFTTHRIMNQIFFTSNKVDNIKRFNTKIKQNLWYKCIKKKTRKIPKIIIFNTKIKSK